MKKGHVTKSGKILSTILKLSGVTFIVGTVIFWLIYFFIDYIPTTTDQQNATFSGIVGIIEVVILIASAVFALALIFSPKKLYKLAGVLALIVALLPFFIYLFANNPDPVFQQVIEISGILEMLLFYIAVPVILSIYSRPRNMVFVFIAVTTVLLWGLALILGNNPDYVLGARYGGFYVTDLFYSLVQAPILLLVAYLAFSKKIGIYYK